MKKIINEEMLYFDILEDGFGRGGFPTFQELLVVAKNIRRETGYGEKNIIKELSGFCQERDENFNYSAMEPSFIRVARKAIANPEFRVPVLPVLISDDEVEKIRKIKDFAFQKVILSCLVMARSSGNPSLFSDDRQTIRMIIDFSGEKLSVNRFVEEVTPIAFQLDIFEHVAGKSSFYRIMDAPSGDAIVSIETNDELYNAGEVYRQFIGGILAWCSECGLEFIKLSNNHRLCENCAKKSREESIRRSLEKKND